METKHTTGPWAEQDWSATGPTAAFDYAVIEETKKTLPEVFTRPVVQARGVGKAVVCTVYGMSEDEVRANARMLAAAPELLEALQAIMPDAVGNHIGGPDTQARIDAARAAIAKATGSAA